MRGGEEEGGTGEDNWKDISGGGASTNDVNLFSCEERMEGGKEGAFLI